MHRQDEGPDERTLEAEAVIDQLERILASADFDAGSRCRALLCFVVEECLAGRADGLSEPAIARRVFGRGENVDPVRDPIVRIQAGRLRRSLQRYYRRSGAADPVRIELPRGRYAPVTCRGSGVEARFPAVEARDTRRPSGADVPSR